MNSESIEAAYRAAQERYAEIGVDTENALAALAHIPISMQCWQGDDVGGFEQLADSTGAGFAATGHYPGRARTADELRSDVAAALSLIPGQHRLNLHAIYAETGGTPVERNALNASHFEGWIEWARALGIGLDFNPTFFAHPHAESGLTLSHPDPVIRQFWIEHGAACRAIGEQMGRALGTPCVTNVWIPDGYKDVPADRRAPRERLRDALDTMFAEERDPCFLLDALESKLFGIGSESYVVGSHEFYMGYAVSRGKLLCLDTGHFHPTESVGDKISAVLSFIDRLLLHVSRGVRWDSDHVVILSDEVRLLAQQIVHGGYIDRVHIGLDYFDASINRIAAWVIGMRAMIQALLLALLDPVDTLRQHEMANNFTARLALMESGKTMPFAAVWDYYCLTKDVPTGMDWIRDVTNYEDNVLSQRA